MSPNATGNSRGLDGVVAAATRMSHVDGQNGVLIIGGYSVEDLAAHATFEAGRAFIVARTVAGSRGTARNGFRGNGGIARACRR